MLKTNNKQSWKGIAIGCIIIIIFLLGILLFYAFKEQKEKVGLELNEIIQSAYLNGTINGRLIFVASMYQFKEFPYLIYQNNQTLIGAVKMCSSDFDFNKYIREKVCGVFK